MGTTVRLCRDPERAASFGSSPAAGRGAVPALCRQRAAPSAVGMSGPPPAGGDRRAELTSAPDTVATESVPPSCHGSNLLTWRSAAYSASFETPAMRAPQDDGGW